MWNVWITRTRERKRRQSTFFHGHIREKLLCKINGTINGSIFIHWRVFQEGKSLYGQITWQFLLIFWIFYKLVNNFTRLGFLCLFNLTAKLFNLSFFHGWSKLKYFIHVSLKSFLPKEEIYTHKILICGCIFQVYRNPKIYYFTVKPMDCDAVPSHVFVSVRWNASDFQDFFPNFRGFSHQTTFTRNMY